MIRDTASVLSGHIVRRPVALARAALVVVSLAPTAGAATDDPRIEVGRFEKVYEPSGVTRLGDGTLIVIEDEPRRPLRQMTITVDAMASGIDGTSAADALGRGLRIVGERRLKPARGLLAGSDVGELDDLEGIARDGSDRVFAIGSHDDAEERRVSDRQKLVRFSVRDGRMVDIALTRRLRRDLLAAHPAIAGEIASGDKAYDALSIEALAFDRRRAQLLIGLRSPRLGKHAVIARLLNPHGYVEGIAPAAFADAPLTMDLDKGGLRALSYDDRSDQLLMVSRRESGGGGAFKLWRMAADGSAPAIRIRLPDIDDAFDDVEGLVPLDEPDDIDGTTGRPSVVLFVRDDGSRDDRLGGGWFTVSRARLGIDDPMRRR